MPDLERCTHCEWLPTIDEWGSLCERCRTTAPNWANCFPHAKNLEGCPCWLNPNFERETKMADDVQPIRAVVFGTVERRETARVVWDLLTAVAMIGVGVWSLAEVLKGNKAE